VKIDRLLSIVVLLLGRDKARAEDLARRFEVTVRTIYRDLEAINASGIPVVAYPGPGGGYAIDPGYTIDRRLLGFEDLRAIVASLKGVNDALGDKAIGAALEKIESLGPREGSRELLEDRVVIDLFPWGRREEERRLVKALEPAIAERRVVSFSYSSYGSEPEERAVEPMTLVFKAYAWYLWGWCRLRGGYRLFKLARMRSLSVGLERFKRRPGAYSRDLEMPAPPTVEVSLRIEPSRAAEAWEWFGGAGAEAAEDGGLRLSARMPAGDWLVRTLLGLGEGVEVLGPESLRAAVAAAAAAVAAANAGPASSKSAPARKVAKKS
jgi:predicted DNA-binding transcriptional regulator YafY